MGIRAKKLKNVLGALVFSTHAQTCKTAFTCISCKQIISQGQFFWHIVLLLFYIPYIPCQEHQCTIWALAYFSWRTRLTYILKLFWYAHLMRVFKMCFFIFIFLLCSGLVSISGFAQQFFHLSLSHKKTEIATNQPSLITKCPLPQIQSTATHFCKAPALLSTAFLVASGGLGKHTPRGAEKNQFHKCLSWCVCNMSDGQNSTAPDAHLVSASL